MCRPRFALGAGWSARLARGLAFRGRPAAALILLAWTAAGCVSPKYRAIDPAKQSAPPQLALVSTENAAATEIARVETVIVQGGPGSWKQTAWWDEYVVTVTNRGTTPIAVVAATVTDVEQTVVTASAEPWTLEKASFDWHRKQRWRQLGPDGRALLIGANIGIAFATPAVLKAALLAGLSSPATVPVVLAGTAALMAAPAVALVSVVALDPGKRREIEAEFHRRRLALPATVEPGHSVSGSLYFRISPGPRELRLETSRDAQPGSLVVLLEPLADLHLKKKK